MIRRFLPPVFAVLAAAAALWGYQNITLLRGTDFWEFRLIVLLIAIVLVLSLLEFLLSKLPPPQSGTAEDKDQSS
ncbi:MAG: hypothetical protein AAGF94_09345 [Pseudomonadota bacterium]